MEAPPELSPRRRARDDDEDLETREPLRKRCRTTRRSLPATSSLYVDEGEPVRVGPDAAVGEDGSYASSVETVPSVSLQIDYLIEHPLRAPKAQGVRRNATHPSRTTVCHQWYTHTSVYRMFRSVLRCTHRSRCTRSKLGVPAFFRCVRAVIHLPDSPCTRWHPWASSLPSTWAVLSRPCVRSLRVSTSDMGSTSAAREESTRR